MRRQVHQADLIDWMIFQQPLFCGLSTAPFLLLEHLIFYKHNTRCLMSLTTVLVLNHNLQMKEHCGKKIISNQLRSPHPHTLICKTCTIPPPSLWLTQTNKLTGTRLCSPSHVSHHRKDKFVCLFAPQLLRTLHYCCLLLEWLCRHSVLAPARNLTGPISWHDWIG